MLLIVFSTKQSSLFDSYNTDLYDKLFDYMRDFHEIKFWRVFLSSKCAMELKRHYNLSLSD